MLELNWKTAATTSDINDTLMVHCIQSLSVILVSRKINGEESRKQTEKWIGMEIRKWKFCALGWGTSNRLKIEMPICRSFVFASVIRRFCFTFLLFILFQYIYPCLGGLVAKVVFQPPAISRKQNVQKIQQIHTIKNFSFLKVSCKDSWY